MPSTPPSSPAAAVTYLVHEEVGEGGEAVALGGPLQPEGVKLPTARGLRQQHLHLQRQQA